MQNTMVGGDGCWEKNENGVGGKKGKGEKEKGEKRLKNDLNIA